MCLFSADYIFYCMLTCYRSVLQYVIQHCQYSYVNFLVIFIMLKY